MGDKFNPWEFVTLSQRIKEKLPSIENRMAKKRPPGGMPGASIAFVDEQSPIGNRWVEEGREAGPLGKPASMEFTVGDGAGIAQQFANGCLVWSPTYGLCRLSKRVFHIWSTNFALLGMPVSDEANADASARVLRCATGSVYDRGGIALYIVHGEAWVRYIAVGAHERRLGLPRNHAIPLNNGGVRFEFDGGEIVWSKSTGARELYSPIAAHWHAVGGPSGWLGLPLTGEAPVFKTTTTDGADGTSKVSTSEEVATAHFFEHGAIVHSSAHGAAAMRTSIYRAWTDNYSGASGPYGLPVASERQSINHTAWVDFEGGVILEKKGKTPEAYEAIDFFVESFQAWGDDGVAGGAQELYVKAQVEEHRDGVVVQTYTAQYPAEGVWSHGNGRPECVVMTMKPARGASVFKWRFEGWDYDWNSSDELLGVLTGQWGIGDVWGLSLAPTDQDGSFRGHFITRAPGTADPKQFRKHFFWRFQNWTTPKLTWDQYAETFADVRQGGSESLSPGQITDGIFYEAKYKTCAANGNCFGICLESIYAQHNRSRYALPLDRFGPAFGEKPDPDKDREIIHTINIRHGYQYGEKAIAWAFLCYALDWYNDAITAYKLSKMWFENGDYPILAIATDQLFGKGHLVRPYRWEESGDVMKIYVADPNTPKWGDTDPMNTLTIQKDGSWQLRDYSGDKDGTKGRIFVYPYNVLAEQPTAPGVGALLAFLGMCLIGALGAADTVQITDESGRRLFDKDLTAPPRWSDLAKGKDRIPDMWPLPTSGGSNDDGSERMKPLKKPPLPQGMTEIVEEMGTTTDIELPRTKPGRVFRPGRRPKLPEGSAIDFQEWPDGQVYMRQGLGRLTHRIALGEDEAAWLCQGPGFSAEVRYTGGNQGIDEWTVHATPNEAPGLSLQSAAVRTLDLTLVATSGRGFRLRGLGVSTGAALSARIAEGGRELLVDHPAAEIAFDLDIRVGNRWVPSGTRDVLRADIGQRIQVRIDPAAGDPWTADTTTTPPMEAWIRDRTTSTLLRRTSLTT